MLARIAKIAKAQKRKLIVDSSGEALRLAIKEGVYLVKPNLAELSMLTGKDALETNDIEPLAQKLIMDGNCEVLVVSMGALGAMLISKEGSYKVEAPIVKRKTTVGAGDSMVAGIVFCLSQSRSLKEALQYGVACGTAATMSSGTALCKKEDVDRLFGLIKTKEI
jgi:6-phosphofructokinase 2